MSQGRPIVLTVAGFDPCGGAGVLADVKTFEQLKTYGMAIVTANTIQTEDRFVSIDWLQLNAIEKGIETLMNQYDIQVVKIGIVKGTAFLKGIVDTIKTINNKAFIVWDPVIKSSSGFTFFDLEKTEELSATMQEIDLLTPNFPEFQLLEKYLHDKMNVLVKGGHRTEQIGVDILKTQYKETALMPEEVSIYPKHGSGCVLSAAIAAYIALGCGLEAACRSGKSYVEHYLNSNTTLIGHHYD